MWVCVHAIFLLLGRARRRISSDVTLIIIDDTIKEYHMILKPIKIYVYKTVENWRFLDKSHIPK